MVWNILHKGDTSASKYYLKIILARMLDTLKKRHFNFYDYALAKNYEIWSEIFDYFSFNFRTVYGAFIASFS